MATDPAKQHFLRTYTNALVEGTAALFVGAGISRPSGYVDWRSLLRDVAEDLGLDVDRETDLVALAQYHMNQHGTRSRLNQLLIDEFTKDAALTETHRLISTLPIRTIWTTNYDDLLEQAFSAVGKRADVKRTENNLATTMPRRDVTIYKMHGDRRLPDEAVLTKEDYEAYEFHRPLFSATLKGDLVEKTFLFLGFSFTDPNIDYILSRIRVLLGKNQRQHFCLMKSLSPPTSRKKADRDTHEYNVRQFAHRMTDLRRYSIQPVIMEDYSEITSLLADLNRRSLLKAVFISGSAADYGPLGENRLLDLCRKLGASLIRGGLSLVSGFGLGLGGSLIMGAMQELGENDEKRLDLRPFPQEPPPSRSLDDFQSEYRERMISRAGSCVFLSGNKRGANGDLVDATGVEQEFEICIRSKKYPIPVGATGHLAERLWRRVMADLDTFYPQGGVKGHFEVIGNRNKSNEQIIEAVLRIIERTSR